MKFGKQSTTGSEIEAVGTRIEKVMDVMPENMTREETSLWMGALSAILRQLFIRSYRADSVVEAWDEMTKFHHDFIVKVLAEENPQERPN